MKQKVERYDNEGEVRMRRLNELQENLNIYVTENTHLRTENTCLKNNEKAIGLEPTRTSEAKVVDESEGKKELLGTAVTANEMAEAISTLAEAIEAINTCLTQEQNEKSPQIPQNFSMTYLTEPLSKPQTEQSCT